MKWLKFIPVQQLFLLAIGAALFFYLSTHGFKLWYPELYEPYIKVIRWGIGVIFVIACLILYMTRKPPSKEPRNDA